MTVLSVVSICIACFTLGFQFKIVIDDIIEKKDKK